MALPDPERDPQFYQGVPARRLVAFAIDVALILCLWLIGAVMGLVVTIFTFGLLAPLVVLLAGSLDFLYRWLMLSQRSATVGMIVTGLEVRDPAGRRCSPGIAFLHTALFYATVIFLPLLIIGWVLMLTSPYHRGLHDTILGTVVINRPV